MAISSNRSPKKSYPTATDQFCGAGGTSTGAKKAGFDVKMALNHWPLAIETHNINHPEVDHDCTDVSACDPRRYPSTDVLFTSPECTNHSQAKGKKRARGTGDLFVKPDDAAERSRATMWDVVRFSEYHNYGNVVVENVVEARDWKLWEPWLNSMKSLGYEHKVKYLNSMFFKPCPQSRDRMYVVFWKKSQRAPDLEHRPMAPCKTCGDKEAYQSWKNSQRQYGKYKTQYIYRCSSCYEPVTPYYYCALNLIDWTIPMVKIKDRKKPLALKTMERIKYGLDKYAGRELIITGRYTSGVGSRVKDAATDVMPTQPGDQSHFLLSQVQMHSAQYGGQINSAGNPYPTQTTRHDSGILVRPPFIAKLRGTGLANSSHEPLGTVTTAGGGNYGLVANSFIQDINNQIQSGGKLDFPLVTGNHGGSTPRPMSDPLSTLTTATPPAIIAPESWNAFMDYFYGSRQSSSLDKAVNTMTTKERAALVLSDSLDPGECYYRCLRKNEIQRAMAFEDSYQVLGTVKEVVRQLGNAVTPPVQEWIAGRIIASIS